jgi:N-acetylneuraminic acid mutarotase
MKKLRHVLGALIGSALVLGIAGCTDLTSTAPLHETLTTRATSPTAAAASSTTGAIDATTMVAGTDSTSTPAGSAVWTDLSPAGLPPAGVGQAMVYELNTGGGLLFGGVFGEALRNDTWGYDPGGNTWTNLSPPGALPPARDSGAMAYDSNRGKVFLFGGYDGSAYLNDTFAYDRKLNTWTFVDPAGKQVPPGRDLAAMVYDSVRGKVLLFGGWNGSTFFNDIWAFDPDANTWTDLSPAGPLPSARLTHSLVYDSTNGVVYLFGGWKEGGIDLNDLWVYDPGANTWTERAPSGGPPAAREGQSMVYDSAANRVILFGGTVTNTSFFNDTWAYDPVANEWTDLDPSGTLPSPRVGALMMYDSIRGKVILYGGWDGASALNDTWAYGTP